MIAVEYQGIIYPSKVALCRAFWDRSMPFTKYYRNFYDRIKHGYSVEVALSSANLQKVSMQDHRGNMFSSVREICKYYQVTNSAIYRALETKTVQQYTEHREKFLRNKGLWEH